MMTILSWILAFVRGLKQRFLRASAGAGPVPVHPLAAQNAEEAAPETEASTPVVLAPPPPAGAPRLKLVKGGATSKRFRPGVLGSLHLVQTATSASALVVSLASTPAPNASRAGRSGRDETFVAGRDARVYAMSHFRGAQRDRGDNIKNREPR